MFIKSLCENTVINTNQLKGITIIEGEPGFGIRYKVVAYGYRTRTVMYETNSLHRAMTYLEWFKDSANGKNESLSFLMDEIDTF